MTTMATSRPIAAVLFDLDGTLADTLADIAAAMDRVLSAARLPTHGRDAYRRFVGSGARALVERALAATERHRIDEHLAQFIEEYTAHLVVDSRPYPGIDDMLTALAARTRPPALAVLSNKPHAATERVVGALFPTAPFQRVYGHRADWPKKPDPRAALALAGELGVAADACLFVGDTAVDMETAARAGMTGVGCAWGFRDRDELVVAGASVVIDQPMDLLELVTAR